MASGQCQKPTTTIEVCPPKTQHGSLGQKISEITNKAFKGYHARHGNSQNQLQCYSQTEVESHGNTSSKKETHYYGQSQTQQDKKRGVSKTEITVCVVQAQITQTDEYEDPPYGTTTTCFRSHGKKNAEPTVKKNADPTIKKNADPTNKKDMNLFRRIKNGMSRHSNEGNNSSCSSSSDSDSDDDKCQKKKNEQKVQPQAGCK